MSLKYQLQVFRFMVGCVATFCEDLVEDLGRDQGYAEGLYTLRVMTVSSSIARLLPDPAVIDTPAEPREAIDVASVATLARNVAESCVQFFFVCADDVPQEEIEFRRLTGLLHGATEMLKLGNEFEAPEEELTRRAAIVDLARTELNAHRFLPQLDRESARRALSGETSIYLTRAALATRMGLASSFVAGVFRILSGYTHSTPSSVLSDVKRYQDLQAGKDETERILSFLSVLLAKHGLWLMKIFAKRPLPAPSGFEDLAKHLVGGAGGAA